MKKITIIQSFVLGLLLVTHLLYFTSCKKPGIDATPAAVNMDGTVKIAAIALPGSEEVFTLAGNGSSDILNHPTGVVVDTRGNFYVAEAAKNRIVKITPAGDISVFAGSGAEGTADGTGTAAQFNFPYGLAMDGDGNILVADRNNNRIRKVTQGGVVTTIAGSNFGYADGTGTLARFASPSAIACSQGNIYVADPSNHCIRVINSSNMVSTLAGIPNSPGQNDGVADSARFFYPVGVAADAAGNVYVSDSLSFAIRKIRSGQVTTLAGNGKPGLRYGIGTDAQFDKLNGLAIDASGNILIAANDIIRQLNPATRRVDPFAGGTNIGVLDGFISVATFNSPTGLVIGAAGNIYVADKNNNRIRQIGFPMKLVAGVEHSLLLNVDKTLWAAGNNLFGQLGDGTNSNKSAPVKITDNVQTMAAGYNHTLFIKNDFTLWATGQNEFGQLGDSTISNKNTPVKIMSNIDAVAAGFGHSLIIEQFNTLWTTGYNAYGQLGDGTTSNKSKPVKIMNRVRAVAAGAYHSLILTTDATLLVTGNNTWGQLGNGTTSNISTPVKIMDNVMAIAAGYGHSLILKKDSSLWAVGLNTSGQLGDGTTINKNIPVKIMDHVKEIAAGYMFSYILKTDNSLWATGDNSNGQLGDGSFTNKQTPVKIMDHVLNIGAGGHHGLIYKPGNTAPWSTGFNQSGQLGIGNNQNSNVWVNVLLP